MTVHGRIAQETPRPRPLRVFRRALDEFSQDRIPSISAAITFFILLALFPALACVASIYGLFADRATIAHELHYVSGFLPEGASTILQADFRRLAALPPEKLNVGFFTALALAVWSASGGVKALIYGLNIAYETRETRGFFSLSLHALLLTAVAVIFVALLIALAVAVPVALARLPFDNWLVLAFPVLAWPLTFVGCVMLSSLIYRYGPNRMRAPWRWATWGGAIASIVWIVGTVLFAWYVRHFGRYDEIYGNLGAIVGFLTWIWLSLVVLLFGAEINAEIDRNSAE